jgi:hypothetical protein
LAIRFASFRPGSFAAVIECAQIAIQIPACFLEVFGFVAFVRRPCDVLHDVPEMEAEPLIFDEVYNFDFPGVVVGWVLNG